MIHSFQEDHAIRASLSLDICHRLERIVLDGLTGREAARRLLISLADGIRLAAKVRAGNPLAPSKCGSPPGCGWLGVYYFFVTEVVEHDPDITMHELRDALYEADGILVHESSRSRLPRRLGFTHKKSLVADERRRADVTRAGHGWIRHCRPRMREEPHRLVFIDETSVKTNMTRLRGCATGRTLGRRSTLRQSGARRASSPD